MSDLDSYIEERKKADKGFAEGFDEGYEQFKMGKFCARPVKLPA